MTNPFDCIANNTSRYFTHRGWGCPQIVDT